MIVAYTFLQDFGENVAGDMVSLDPEKAQPLVDAGILAEATEEDVNGQHEETPAEESTDETPVVVEQSISRLTDSIEKTLTRATEIALQRASKSSASFKVPATVKSEPAIKNMGELMCNIYKARIGGNVDAQNRLKEYENEMRTKAPTGVNTATDSEGGFTVNPEFSDEIWKAPRTTVNLQDLCTLREASSNTLNVRAINESSLAAGSIYGGISIAVVGEGNDISGSKPTYANVPINLQKYAGLVYFTSEVLEDSAYNLEADIRDMVSNSFVFKINRDLINANNEVVGALNTPSLITVAKEGGQAAATVLFANVAKMWTRMYADSKPNAVWLVNPEVEQQLIQMAFTTGGTTSAHGLTFNAAEPFPLSLFGRPVIPCWACSQLGNAGDVLLCDYSQYILYRKPFRVDVSRDINFVNDEIAFRFILRLGAKSPWQQALTGQVGSTTYSPVIALETRGTA